MDKSGAVVTSFVISVVILEWVPSGSNGLFQFSLNSSLLLFLLFVIVASNLFLVSTKFLMAMFPSYQFQSYFLFFVALLAMFSTMFHWSSVFCTLYIVMHSSVYAKTVQTVLISSCLKIHHYHCRHDVFKYSNNLSKCGIVLRWRSQKFRIIQEKFLTTSLGGRVKHTVKPLNIIIVQDPANLFNCLTTGDMKKLLILSVRLRNIEIELLFTK